MKLSAITQNIGKFTSDSILITRAEPINALGPEIVWCNEAFSAMTGYSLDEIRGKTPRILQGPKTDREPLDKIRAALEAWRPVVTVVKNYTKAGDAFYSEVSIQPVADEAGYFHYWVAVQRDVTERVERERHLQARNAALEESEKALQEEKIQLSGIAAVAEHAHDLITITDTDFRILWANRAFLSRSGYPAAAVRGSAHCDLLNKRSAKYNSREMAQKAILQNEFRDDEVRNVDRYGGEFWTDVRVSVQRDRQGRAERFVVVERDITEQRRQRDDLERSRRDLELNAIRDPLTGLLNRRGFEEALSRMAQKCEALQHGVGLLQIDLDYFKQINDTLGHAAGDAVLMEIAERLQRHMGPESFASRIGGDEFVVALELYHPDQDLPRFAERLRKSLARPVKYDQSDCRFSVSIGYTERLKTPFDVSAMLVEADVALYRAKADGRNCASGFTAEVAEATRRKKTLADQISVALDNGDFYPLYQPQFDAETGRLAGAEALLRWDMPEGGRVAPFRFLPLARELNLEARIDRLILSKALEDFEYMTKTGVALPKISVNVSALRLRSKDLIRDIDQIKLPENGLSFELLESTFLDDNDPQLMWTLDALRERKINIEIDDFGTGHASIMGLLRIRPDRLKTDRSLLAPAVSDPRNLRLYDLIVQIGQTLNIEVTAEGVETEEHARVARELGCTVLQGFLYSAPITVEQLVEQYGREAEVA